MRANLPILKRPDVVMKIAREEGALREIERMTMFRATEAFADLREKKRIKGDALLFINSIASQHMAAKDEIELIIVMQSCRNRLLLRSQKKNLLIIMHWKQRKMHQDLRVLLHWMTTEVDTVTRRVFLIWHRSISK